MMPPRELAGDGTKVQRIWLRLVEAYGTDTPDVSMEDLFQCAEPGAVFGIGSTNYLRPHFAYINRILEKRKLQFRVKPGKPRATYTISTLTDI